MKYILPVLILASLLVSCNLASPATTPTISPTQSPTLEFTSPTALPSVSPVYLPTISTVTISTPLLASELEVFQKSAEALEALKSKDMASLAQYVDPQIGLRFSPYAAVKDTDQLFKASQVSGLITDTTVYTWGAYTGSGEPINLSFTDYYAKFIYDEDFVTAPQVALNHRLGVSTSMDTSANFYPGAIIVEYYFPGFDPALEGMDWRSLRLVFLQEDGIWYLAGIIHDQWTT